mmetsp:Transcript_119733/g.382171  ORF Transcript_119733/g.382171 Transcript_119733/m.382171 type:complete len:304 (-) Transcript_119733:202-1113(-)
MPQANGESAGESFVQLRESRGAAESRGGLVLPPKIYILVGVSFRGLPVHVLDHPNQNDSPSEIERVEVRKHRQQRVKLRSIQPDNGLAGRARVDDDHLSGLHHHLGVSLEPGCVPSSVTYEDVQRRADGVGAAPSRGTVPVLGKNTADCHVDLDIVDGDVLRHLVQRISGSLMKGHLRDLPSSPSARAATRGAGLLGIVQGRRGHQSGDGAGASAVGELVHVEGGRGSCNFRGQLALYPALQLPLACFPCQQEILVLEYRRAVVLCVLDPLAWIALPQPQSNAAGLDGELFSVDLHAHILSQA